jgi:hypothetical protein
MTSGSLTGFGGWVADGSQAPLYPQTVVGENSAGPLSPAGFYSNFKPVTCGKNARIEARIESSYVDGLMANVGFSLQQGNDMLASLMLQLNNGGPTLLLASTIDDGATATLTLTSGAWHDVALDVSDRWLLAFFDGALVASKRLAAPIDLTPVNKFGLWVETFDNFRAWHVRDLRLLT